MGRESYDRSGKLADARVSRHGRRAHLRYDVPQRLNTTKVYPLPSHRGSEILVSGHEDGLYIMWRGGKPMQGICRTITIQDQESASGVHVKSEWNEAISIHKRDQAGIRLVSKPPPIEDRPAFEAEEAELDDDDTGIPFTQELNLSLGSAVLHIAAPTIPPPSASGPVFNPEVPIIMQANIVLVVACADASVRVIAVPLTPPTASAKRAHTLSVQICHIVPAAPGHAVPSAVSLSWTPESKSTTPTGPREDEVMEDVEAEPGNQSLDLLVALSMSGLTGTLHFFRIPTEYDENNSPTLPDDAYAFQTVQLAAPAHHVSFNPSTYPSPKHSQLLLTDDKGFVRVYDPLPSESARSRPTSRDSEPVPADLPIAGTWITHIGSSFHLAKETSSAYSGLAQRKRILDTHWVSGGRSVIVLLSDGEWGVWDVDGNVHKSMSNTNATSLTDFVIKGFIGEGSTTEATAAPELRSRTNQRLAPMTPNTRKVRQESLFSGPSNTGSGNARKGGISVASTNTSHGVADDSVVMWYAGEAYHIPSLNSIWQRSVNSSGRDVGSLYGPGLARIEGLDMSGEILNDIEQFPARSTTAISSVTAHRDILITGEYRFVIISAPKQQVPTRSLFARDAGSPTSTYDLKLLEKGELDIGGMDRLLDGMGDAGRPKRVGFVR